MAQKLKALSENLGLISGTHMVPDTHLECRNICRQNTPKIKLKNNKTYLLGVFVLKVHHLYPVMFAAYAVCSFLSN